jgi:hypothetical protein
MNGFTVVFRIRPTRGSLLSSTTPLISQLLRDGRAHRVLENYHSLDSSDLANVFTVIAGSEYQSRELLERLQADETVDLAYVAPPRWQLTTRRSQTTGTRTVSANWHRQIRLPEAQTLRQWKGTSRVWVSAVDSGCDVSHPQLTAVKLNYFVASPTAQPDFTGHGTHVCGLISARSAGNSFSGLASDCVDLQMQRGLTSPYDPATYYRALRAAADQRST